MKRSFLVLLLLSCVYLDDVTQPSSVAIGESFTLTINGDYEGSIWTAGNAGIGIMLPIGFVVDSVVYYSSDTIAGVVYEVDSVIIFRLEYRYPCDSQMCWQAFSIYDLWPTESIGTYVASVYGQATASTAAGTYLIDYRSGHAGWGRWDCDDSILNQPMLVTGTAVGEIVEHRTSKRNTVWPTIFKNTLNIFTDNADQVEIFSEDGRLVKSFRITPNALRSTLSWDGRDDQNRMLGSGVYFVKFLSGDYEETEKVLLIK
jgi:hypothetical protein